MVGSPSASPVPEASLNCTNFQTMEERGGKCACHPGFYGSTCSELREPWTEIGLAIHVFGSLGQLIFMIWSVLKFAHIIKSNTFRLNLSIIAQLCTFLGSLSRFIYFVYPNLGIMRNYSTLSEQERLNLAILGATLSSLAPAFWMAGCGLVAGFWIDALARKLKPKMAKHARIFFIIMASTLVICIVGVVYGIIVDLFTGTIITLVPVLLNTLCLLVAAIILACWTNKGLSPTSKDKKVYAARVIGLSAGSWIFFTLSLILFAVSTGDQDAFGYLYMIALLFMIIFEFGIVLSTLLLVDRHGGPIRLSRYLCCGDEEALSASVSLSTNTPSGQSDTASAVSKDEKHSSDSAE